MTHNPKLEPDLADWLENAGDATQSKMAIADRLDSLYADGPDPQRTVRAIRSLRASLQAIQNTEILYGGFSHPKLGPVFVALGGQGVIAVNFGISERAFRKEIRRRTGTESRRSERDTAPAAAQLSDYLAGRRTRFNLPVDLASLTPFQQQVLAAAAEVPPGQVATYAEIAQRIGRPRAYRAVGQALGRNPVPILIPCHRVIATDGSLGGYSGGGGLKTKAHLLALEGASV